MAQTAPPTKKASAAAKTRPAAKKAVAKAPVAAVPAPAPSPVPARAEAAGKAPKAAKSAKPPKAAKADKPAKPGKAEPKAGGDARKLKLVRDSFTIPKPEYAALDALKARAAKAGLPGKKSEVLRAGIMVLASLDDAAFRAAMGAVPTLKTGRPKKG